MSRLATHTSNSTHRYRSKIIEKILKWIYKYVHSGTVHSSQRTEITKIPLRGEWINKMKYVHSTEYYSVVNTNEILTHTNCRWTSKPMWKKPDTKRSHIVWFNVYKVARSRYPILSGLPQTITHSSHHCFLCDDYCPGEHHASQN